MNQLRYSQALLIILAALLLPACSLLTADYKNLKEPKVSVTGLRLKDINPLRPSFQVQLKVDNPNDLDLNMDGADMALALNGQAVAEGVSLSPLVLKKLGSSEMAVEVTANTLNAAQALLGLQSRTAMDYKVTGHLHLLNWLGALGKLPFSYDGKVERDALLSGAGLK